jgi:hypothetical protein
MLKRVRHETRSPRACEISPKLRLEAKAAADARNAELSRKKEMRIRLFKQQPDSHFIALLKLRRMGCNPPSSH